MRTINIDISDLYRTLGRSGIQRVVREVTAGLLRWPSETFTVRVIRFDYVEHVYRILDPQLVSSFLSDDEISLDPVGSLPFSDFGTDDVFLDMDSAWNSPLKRPDLYRRLKERGVMIVTFVHDLIPLELPQVAHPNTLRNWSLYISAVYAYTDLAFFESRASESKFEKYKGIFGVERIISTVVVRAGADFAKGGVPTAQELAALDPFRSSTYLLFVSTIEPRKLHRVALEAIDLIHASAPDVHLVFVGRRGWHSEETLDAILDHELMGFRVHWIDGPSDALIDVIYAGAAMTVYLTRAEGYGLPVAESLARGKITIASDNSSIYEVGEGFADYVHFNTAGEVAETALAYLLSPRLAELRRQQIKSGYHPVTWEIVATTIARIFENLEQAAAIAARPLPESVQWLMISNVPQSLARTIPLVEKHVSWLKEFVIVAPAKLRDEILAIESTHPIRFVPEEGVLGDDLAEFRASDHVRKNWMLRSRVPNVAEVEDHFVMLDDDAQPLVDVPLSTFLRPGPRYTGYYFYEMPRWPHRRTDYDYGVLSGKQTLIEAGFEVLLYSAHQPQIFNKELFAAAVATVTELAPNSSLDEWSSYFDFVASRYPTLLDKKPMLTFNWPGHASSWAHWVTPTNYVFENYYPIYQEVESGPEGVASHERVVIEDTRSVAAKIADKQAEERPFERSVELFRESEDIISALGLAHGSMVFESDGAYLVVAGVPHVITIGAGAPLRLHLTFTRLGRPTRYEAGVFGRETQFCYRIVGQSDSTGTPVEDAQESVSFGMSVEDAVERELRPDSGVLEVSFPGREGQMPSPGVYELDFFAKFEGEIIFPEGVSYRSRLVVCGPEDTVPEVYEAL